MLICVHSRYGTPKSAISHIMWLGISCSNRFLNENGEYGYPALGTVPSIHHWIFLVYNLGMGQNHSKPKTRHRNSTYTISSIYHPSVYNIIYQNWLHLHTSPFLSTLERPEADAKCWRLPAESRLLLGG